MSRRIMFACFEVPGWGGAATSRYKLFERMQREGYDVAYVNLVTEPDELFFRLVLGESFDNPRRLASVFTCVLAEPIWRPQPALRRRIDEWRPDLIVGVGVVAAHLLRLAAPELPLVFLPSGSKQIRKLVEDRIVRDFIEWRRWVQRGALFTPPAGDRERKAVQGADFIVLHSQAMSEAFAHYFPAACRTNVYQRPLSYVADLIYAEAETFAESRRPFEDRDIDVLFVSTSWIQPNKNYALVRELVGRNRDLDIHLVGVSGDGPIGPAREHGIVAKRADLYQLYGRTRVVVSPSLWDAAPGVLFEASAMGCNVVATPNCGNVELCHSSLVAPACREADISACIRRAVRQPYADHRDDFLGDCDELIETLAVL